jgi:gas vesicle protein
MSRMRLALTVTAASVAAGAVGCALGMLFAPASGTEVRRRLAWRAQQEYRSMGRTCEQMFERAAKSARHELQARAERVFEQVGKACAR